jgi:hypothetical protein
MAQLTPSQERTRDRFEMLIGMMAPGLSLVLAAGDRISRIVQPEDFDYYPVRPLGEWEPRACAAKPAPEPQSPNDKGKPRDVTGADR